MLSFEGVALHRGGALILSGVTLRVAAGEVLVLMGRSGIGKTSLLHAAAGLLPVSAGRIAVRGRRAVVFQEPRLLPWRSALDNAALGLKALGVPRPARRERAASLLRELGLRDEDLLKRPHALSGGMRQRVAIARALAVEPAVLLLDEPFAALDAGLRAELQQRLREAVRRRHLATLLVTHDVVEAVRVGDRVALLAGRPAGLLPPLPLTRPAATDAAVFEACAGLLRRPGVAEALGLLAQARQPSPRGWD
ncbi:ATP-binding cassette domain-containing protein [Rhodovastum atsumiense]|uniref:ATP-binding cassette domain-containing protein n=1 Tax=Rhodovastum atsumiense TaxID=504468 RepID=A0A5M6IYU3_9PROT|nr:ATP-binding cassette domain-containing protein [Rhodovastum atsumiense]KAA5613520.1 ATP-binding cassette domain-containing protein [Rhodovastum atsumiense]CAH2603268.1 ATP-binding cassette domain-containing protein [Rhodovastum atsumiense]